MLRTGSPWRALPEKYGSWKTVYSRFRRRQKRGYLTAVLEFLSLQADMTHIIIDGTYVHAHKHSAGARHTSGHNQALSRGRGGFTSKIHAVVDALDKSIAACRKLCLSSQPDGRNLSEAVHALNLPILDGQAIKRWSESPEAVHVLSLSCYLHCADMRKEFLQLL